MMMFSMVNTRIGNSSALHLSSQHSNAKTRLAVALSRVPTLTARHKILESILSGYIGRTIKPDDDPLRLWARETIVNALSSLSHATEEDGRTLAAIEQQYGKDILTEKDSDM